MIDVYCRLAEGVVWRALEDVGCRAVHQTPEAERVRVAADALDFLLRRIWEDDCLWGAPIRRLLVVRRLRERAIRGIRADVVREAARCHADLRPILRQLNVNPRTGRHLEAAS